MHCDARGAVRALPAAPGLSAGAARGWESRWLGQSGLKEPQAHPRYGGPAAAWPREANTNAGTGIAARLHLMQLLPRRTQY